jgi:hypothetical protein
MRSSLILPPRFDPERRRLLVGAAAMAAFAALTDDASASLMTTGSGKPSAGSGPPTVTWDPVTIDAVDHLSNQNLTVTHTAAATQTMPRANLGVSSGNKFAVFTLNSSTNVNNLGWGVCDSTVGPSGHYVGETSHSGGYVANGAITGAGSLGVNPYVTVGQSFVMAWLATPKTLHIGRDAYGWDITSGGVGSGDPDPAVNIGGSTLSGITGSAFFMASLYDNTASMIVNFSSSGYPSDVAVSVAYLLSKGFTALS